MKTFKFTAYSLCSSMWVWMVARIPSGGVRQKSQTLCRIDIFLPLLPNNSPSQVGTEKCCKINRLRAASRELTMPAFKARGVISQLNLRDLSHLGRLVKQPEKLEEKATKKTAAGLEGFSLISGKMHNSSLWNGISTGCPNKIVLKHKGV